MSNILKKIIAGATVLTCAVMMVAPGMAQALTADELQTQIDVLMAELATLQTELATMTETTTTTTVIEGCDITSFDRNLKQGMSGDDVKCLQIIMNSDADTKLADSGAGSPGSETKYFGPITKAGVIKFQTKYADEVLASWGLTTGTGFVGTTTRAKLDSLLTAEVEPVTPPVTPPVGCDCTEWANDSCGAGTCSATQMQQTRTCTPVGCAAEAQCVSDTSCEVAEV
ncbi:MAG: hypothetical protein U9Q27_01320, partial [Patescibacteria group bacterium]|nr:hypothetical protein [Patescibacteria group bacterium]